MEEDVPNYSPTVMFRRQGHPTQTNKHPNRDYYLVNPYSDSKK